MSEKRPRKLLIIDDDELNTTALQKRLERRGFQVVSVFNSAEAMAAIESEQPEVVLLDIVMPQIDGISVLKEIRSRYDKNRMSVLMVTGIDDSFNVIDSFNQGANDYITKPVNVDVALARINAHLSVIDLHKELVEKSEIAAIGALITTYNHEINNPLSIAIGALHVLERKSKDIDKESLEKVQVSLQRVSDIVKRIREASEGGKVNYDTYIGTAKMIKVK